jgi:hypothetical protein
VDDAVKSERRAAGLAGSRGSILLEVMLATLLIGILVVPLATAFAGAVDQARVLRDRLAEQPAAEGASQPAASWEWGLRVIAAWWRPGPVLHIRVSEAPSHALAATHVGLWADGCLIAEQSIASDQNGVAAVTDDMQLGPDEWAGLVEGELVMRVRATGGVWGPPWRLAVPARAEGPRRSDRSFRWHHRSGRRSASS